MLDTTRVYFLQPDDLGKKVSFVDIEGRAITGPLTGYAPDVVRDGSEVREFYIEIAGRTFLAPADAIVEIA